MLTLKEDTMLGDIPSDWDTKPLHRLLSASFPGDWGEESGSYMTYVLRSTNLTKDGRLDLRDIAVRSLPAAKARLLTPRKYDILLERSGGGPGQPVGRVGLVEEDLEGYIFSNFLHLLRPDPKEIDERFLGWILYSINQTGRVVRLEQQTTQMRNLHLRDYLTMPLPVPPPEEQAAIARILDVVDMALAQVREVVERARDLRSGLLAHLLSHGIGKNGKVRHDGEGHDEFVVTPLGRLPSTWKLSSVECEFDIQNGFTLNAERRARLKKRRYLRVANVQRDSLDLTDVQELEASDSEFAPRVLALDDLLVVEGHADRMAIGRCARVSGDAVGMTFQNHLFRLRSKGAILPAFGCLWLNSTYAQRFWNARCATSSGLNTINQRMLKQLIVPVPCEAEQQAIASIIEKQREHLEELRRKQKCLDILKKALMHDLLTGRIRISAEG